jgi:pimeloyl-ACP methyl ester carboxylesterase
MNSALRLFTGFALRVPFLRTKVVSVLFSRPFGRLNDEERQLPDTAGRDVFVFGQRRVRARVHGQGQPVFLVHGWGGEGQQMSAFVDAVVARGYQAVTVDLPAHGASTGTTTNLLECRDALLALGRELGNPALVVAHSFGAAAVALAEERGLGAEALVFIAPLPSLEVGIEQFARRAGIPVEVVEQASRRIEQKHRVEREHLRLKDIAARLRTPLLLVHDRVDTTISLEESEEIARSGRDVRLLITEGLGHRRILRAKEVVERALAFAEQGFIPRSAGVRLQSA